MNTLKRIKLRLKKCSSSNKIGETCKLLTGVSFGGLISHRHWREKTTDKPTQHCQSYRPPMLAKCEMLSSFGGAAIQKRIFPSLLNYVAALPINIGQHYRDVEL